jgi:hypothetical protein
MNLVAAFYKIWHCIKSSTTIDHVNSCERMIDNLPDCLMILELRDAALLRRCELLITIYEEVE